MKSTPPRWNLVLLRVSAFVTCLVLVEFIICAVCLPARDEWTRFTGAFTLYAIGLLCLASLLCFWGHPRAALRGLCLTVAALVLGVFFPQL